MTTAPLTDAELAEIDQWYRDPVRTLPRKVVRDVAALVAEVRRLRDDARALRKALSELDERHFLDCTVEPACGNCTVCRARAAYLAPGGPDHE